MKKITTTLLAAGLLLSASACSAPQQLSTADTCSRVKTVISNPTNSTDKTGMIRFANQIRPIVAVSSDELKPTLKAIVDYLDESVKDNPDSAKLNTLKADYQNAGTNYGKYCGS
ncbi:hypothetical protein [Arthrobacter sp. MMS18-M83]|uniref:hypothetical protein n=1 Tax=unclassified Arthrobacter TaxID=235627 RepID=UPI00227AD4BF|nr:hypothetical protein [Arthrobacter sp. MMS18-M83]UKA62324.1 hypothetical protein LFT43_17525 [Arthrobacter sp. FW306-04-A]WAH95692.1 hypothetical protein OW521_14695 [Arthrobacter sp. MMS18-M83]